MADARTKPLALDVSVASEDLSYPVVIGAGLLERLGPELRRHGSARKVALISDENVMPLHGSAARASLEHAGFEVVPLVVPPGEGSKSAETLFELTDQMVAAGLGRRDAVVALGGGVVGDLAGLAAALFMRGVAFVQCPTSLLAQVDASVGGKVAIDRPAGKNLVGTFYFPEAVLIDPLVLQTLEDRQLACGAAEMLKHGALFSPEHFAEVVDGTDAIFARDAAVLAKLVARSVALKAACVSRDPLEHADAGKGRVLLNLGHTVGHAIESVSGFELLHGEAVAIGLRAAARLSEARGVAGAGLEAQLAQALQRLRLPIDLDRWLEPDVVRRVEGALTNDKKRSSGTVTYIALARLGEPRVLALGPAEIMALLRPETSA